MRYEVFSVVAVVNRRSVVVDTLCSSYHVEAADDLFEVLRKIEEIASVLLHKENPGNESSQEYKSILKCGRRHSPTFDNTITNVP